MKINFREKFYEHFLYLWILSDIKQLLSKYRLILSETKIGVWFMEEMKTGFLAEKYFLVVKPKVNLVKFTFQICCTNSLGLANSPFLSHIFIQSAACSVLYWQNIEMTFEFSLWSEVLERSGS